MNDPGARRYVAIVDDDSGARTALARLLRAVGMRVDTYASAEELLAVDKPWPYQCLVLDVRLTGMNGLELQRRVALRRDPPPVILLSADDDPDTCEVARRQGAVAFFGKTDPGAKLIEAIELFATEPRAAESRGRIATFGTPGA